MHLFQRFHGNADGSCGEDRTDEHIFQHPGAFNQSRRSSAAGQSRVHDQRHDDAQQRHQKTGLSAVLQFVDVGSHTGGKHQDNDAQFAELRYELRFRQDIQTGRTKDQASQQSAHHLRHLETLGQKSQQLGSQQDQRKVQ